MRVTLLTSTGIYPYDIGGPAVFLGNLYRSLASRFDVKVILLTRRRFFSTPIVSLLGNPLECLHRIGNSELLILNSPPSGVILPLLFLRRLLNKKNVLIAHGGLFIELKGLRAGLYKAIVVGALKKVRCLVVSPSYCLRDLLFQSFGIKSVVIHNSVDLRYVKSIASHDFRSKNNVIYVGFLRRIKGVYVLLEAIKKLLTKGLPCNLYVIGRGVLEEALSVYVRQKGLSKFVHFMGTMNNKQVLEMIKGADMVVLPSYWENFPTVILEAMACGKPVVASRVGGIPEIIQDGYNGILFPKGDSDALAKSVSFLLQNPIEAKKLGGAARRTIKSGFTLNVMTKKYLRLIEQDNTRVQE